MARSTEAPLDAFPRSTAVKVRSITAVTVPEREAQRLFQPEPPVFPHCPDGGGRPATGILDDEGHFELSTFKRKDGALLGKHRVTIDPPVILDGAAKSPDQVVEIPKKYTDVEQTPLEREVTAEGENTFDFELEGE